MYIQQPTPTCILLDQDYFYYSCYLTGSGSPDRPCKSQIRLIGHTSNKENISTCACMRLQRSARNFVCTTLFCMYNSMKAKHPLKPCMPCVLAAVGSTRKGLAKSNLLTNTTRTCGHIASTTHPNCQFTQLRLHQLLRQVPHKWACAASKLPADMPAHSTAQHGNPHKCSYAPTLMPAPTALPCLCNQVVAHAGHSKGAHNQPYGLQLLGCSKERCVRLVLQQVFNNISCQQLLLHWQWCVASSSELVACAACCQPSLHHRQKAQNDRT
mgnify:CR=1 FL=1